MFNYYLFNPSYENAQITDLEDNLQTLQTIFTNRRENENFLKHDSIWDIAVKEGTFGEVIFQNTNFRDQQFVSSVLPKLLEQINSVTEPIISIDDFNSKYRLYNAFYGINFTGITPTSCITNLAAYQAFFRLSNWELTPQTFWKRRGELFSRIILCPEVENQITTIGGTFLNQIIDRIRELDNYVVQNWNNGAFSYHNVNNNSSLNISPESSSTMQQDKLRNQRVFSLPGGRRECFELHIKTGNLRFHFFPENSNIFIGYIGHHLPTSRH